MTTRTRTPPALASAISDPMPLPDVADVMQPVSRAELASRFGDISRIRAACRLPDLRTYVEKDDGPVIYPRAGELEEAFLRFLKPETGGAK